MSALARRWRRLMQDLACAAPVWLANRLSTRPCSHDACRSGSFHTAHLTAFGRYRYTNAGGGRRG